MTRFGYAILVGILIVISLVAWQWPSGKSHPSIVAENPTNSTATVPASKDDLIVVTAPLPDSTIENPVTVRGRARGSWYFEASFPVKIYDGTGKLLGSGPATARGEWMTGEYVPFEATISFTVPSTAAGKIVFEKDNPSGLPEHANELSVPVHFQNFGTSTAESGRTVQLYYYNASLDGGACSKAGLVAVERTIRKTETPLADTIELLLQNQLTDAEKAQGLSTEFPLEGVSLKKAAIAQGVATLTFDDLQNKLSGGACRTGVMRAEIEATVKQFPSVNSVVFEPTSLFQP